MNRRRFLRSASAVGAMLPWMPSALAGRLVGPGATADLVVVGGGFGGCAAALAACRAGLRVVMTEETDWIGGQATSQAVPPDEHPWIEGFGCTRSYRRFRDGVRQYYRDHFPLTPAARANAQLNPGNGWVSRLCHEPRVALAVLHQMLAPHVAGGRLRILLQARPVAADVDGDRLRAVDVEVAGQGRVTLEAPLFVDATELGDLLPLAGVEHVTGAESRRDTGEPHAPEEANPLDQQAITWCFAMDHPGDGDFTIDRPAEYDFWRSYVPAMRPAWTGRLLDWANTHPVTLEPRTFQFDPAEKLASGNIWSYRRIADAGQFVPGTYPSGISLVNWPQNDYWLGPLVGPGVTPESAATHLRRARQLSLSLLYWMQTEAPRPDGGAGWKGLRLRGDVTDGPDGLAKAAYIRESRRILAEVTVVEQHLATEARMALTGKARDEVTAEAYPDSVGIGAYRIDLHPGTGGTNYIDISALPFQIPLGSLIPRRVDNLLAGAKNLGVTHLTNGCYRLHPVEWNIGEAAGALAAYCRDRKAAPRQVRSDARHLAAFRQRLRDDGFELEWPRLRPL